MDSLDGYSDLESGSDSEDADHHAGPHVRQVQRAPWRAVQARASNDVITVEDDYNTDDPLDDSDSYSERSSSPVQVRSGARIQTTRGQQVGAARAAARLRLAPARGESVPAVTEEMGIRHDGPEVGANTQNSRPADSEIHSAEKSTSEVPTAGSSRRVPPLARPRRKNLVCPQCRSRVSLPPFPIFVLRGVADLLSAQTEGRRAQSMEAEREHNTIIDATWGGLFPRAAG